MKWRAIVLLWSYALLGQQVANPLESAYRFMAAGDWQAAGRELSARILAFPRDISALTARAYVFSQLGDHEQAIAFARRALAINPKDESARNSLALSLISSGKRGDGIAELSSILKGNPNHPSALRNLGLAYLQAGSPGRAVPLLERRLQLEPRDQLVRIDLIGTLYQLGYVSRAVELTAAVPNEPVLLEKLCRTLNEHYRYSETIKRLESVSRQAPLESALRVALAEAYTGAGSVVRAAEILATLPATERNSDYTLALAWTFTVQNNLPSAIQALQAAIQTEPEDARLYHALSMLLLRGGAVEDAIDAASHGLERIPDSAVLLLSLGMGQAYLGRYDDAKSALRRCLALDPANGLAHYVLALSYLISGETWGVTEKEFQAALQIRPNDPLIASNYARELLKRQQYAEARKMADIAAQSPEFEGAADAIRGHIFLAEDKFEDATRSIQSAIQKDPDQYSETYRLGLAYMRTGDRAKAREYLGTFAALKDAAKERDRQREILKRMARYQ